ncbi:MAG: hypothetical protein P8O22_04265 [Akkermansiaceae bacterium]|nr:hypothetical protein [Akkermansiaceae bacterium]
MIDWLSNNLQIEQLIWTRPVSSGVLIAAFGAVVALTVYLYIRRQGLPLKIRIALALARLIVLSLLVAALFEPAAVVSETHTTKRQLAVLVDVSKSMTIKDQRKKPEDVAEAATALGLLPFSGSTDVSKALTQLDANQRQQISSSSRLDLAKTLLSRSASSMLDSLGENIDISYYRFGDSLRMLSDNQSNAAETLNTLQADDAGTAITEALETLSNIDRGAPLSGVVLLTDGLDTSPRRADEALNDLGRYGIPVYPVPMGITEPDDVSIRNVIIQEVAFAGDKVPVRVQIRSKGYEKRIADITVLLNDQPAATKSVSLEGGLQFEDLFFNVNVQDKGAARIKVSITPFADETTEENNHTERSVRVVNEKINVLCIEGSARWEYRYLRAMLKRDPRINATFIATRAQPELAQNSSEYIARFPNKREDAFQYDLVILGDVDAKFFNADELSRLEELIKERGGSLLMLCGSRFAPTSYAGTTVEKMLPVNFDPKGKWQEVDDSVHPVLTPEGRSSLVLTLENETEKNDRVWTRVAPLDRVPPLLSAKPGATVLAEMSDSSTRSERYPLVAWHRYGSGKCMVMGTDRLWLLRFKTGDKYHWRAWSQSIQFLTLSRLMGEHKRIRLETDRGTYQSGAQVQLYAHVLDDAFDPVNQSGFEVNVTHQDAADSPPQRVTLRPDLSNPGLYEGYFSPLQPGRYRMEANSADAEISSTTEFQVADINSEMANTDMQRDRLQKMADLSGGTYLTAMDFHKLQSLLNSEPHTSTVRTDRSLWDNGWIIFLLVTLMGFEWIVRRRYDLS